MKIIRMWLIASVIIICMQSQSMAGFISGNMLVENMREYDKAEMKDENTDYNKAWEYMGYVTGVYDASEFLYSAPDTITRGQICAIVAKYLKAHPEEWAQSASSIIIIALQEAFPKKPNK